jgi:hypothetical protein
LISNRIDVDVYAVYRDSMIGTRVKEDYNDVVKEREMR